MVKEGEFVLTQAGALMLGRFGALRSLGLQHFMSTRLGGCSPRPWDSLNLGYHVEDASERVSANRRLFCAAAGARAEDVVSLQQVHGTTVAVVGEADRGRGAFSWEGALDATDAVVTAAPGVPLLLLVADCVPVLLFDPRRRVLGLAHAGWKGTVAGIAAATLAVMQERFGSRPADCVAAFGPSIGACCYAVGEAVLERLPPGLPPQLLPCREGQVHLDLRGLNAWLLRQAGVPEGNLLDAGCCTCCRKDVFFSHRGDSGRSGRLGLLAWL